jgi:hypothetical protein
MSTPIGSDQHQQSTLKLNNSIYNRPRTAIFYRSTSSMIKKSYNNLDDIKMNKITPPTDQLDQQNSQELEQEDVYEQYRLSPTLKNEQLWPYEVEFKSIINTKKKTPIHNCYSNNKKTNKCFICKKQTSSTNNSRSNTNHSMAQNHSSTSDQNVIKNTNPSESVMNNKKKSNTTSLYLNPTYSSLNRSVNKKNNKLDDVNDNNVKYYLYF